MQLGMVGLGRMGANLTRRLMRAGHEVVVHDIDADAIRVLEGEGATGAAHARGSGGRAAAAARRVDHGAGRLRGRDRGAARRAAWTRATS